MPTLLHGGVGPRFAPVLLEPPDDAAVIDADRAVEHRQHLRCSKCPAFLQHQVVNVLHPDAREFLDEVETVEEFLEMQEGNFPGTALFADRAGKSVGRASMAAAGVKVYESQLWCRRVFGQGFVRWRKQTRILRSAQTIPAGENFPCVTGGLNSS